MELLKLLIIIAIALFVLALILFPEFRTLFRGFTRVFIKDMATTPEGAQALYEQKIAEAEESFAKADSAYKKASGKLHTAQNDLKTFKQKLSKVEAACEGFVKDNNMEMAQLKAEEREEILSSIARCEELVKVYTAAVEETRDVYTKWEKRVRDLKREAKEVVENMRTKKQIAEIYDDMDELKVSTATDKLLNDVKEKNKDLNEYAAGAKAVHENRTSTKLDKADAEARKMQTSEYLNSLKARYNK